MLSFLCSLSFIDSFLVLKPFDAAITFFSYEERPSVSCILLALHGVIQSLSCTAGIHKFKEEVTQEIKRWDFGHFTNYWHKGKYQRGNGTTDEKDQRKGK